MTYKKQEYENFNLHLINTDRFKTIKVSFTFTNNFVKEDLAFSNLLINMLTHSCEKYNSKKKLAIKLEDLYLSDVTSRFSILGNYQVIELGIDFINPKYTEEKLYKEVFGIFKEMLLYPNLEGNSFNKEIFEINKNNLIHNYKLIKDDVASYATLKYKEIMFKNTPYQYSPMTELNSFENISSEELYVYYKKLFDNYVLNVMVVGDFIEDVVVKEITDIMSNIKRTNYKLKPLYMSDIKVKSVKEKQEKSSFNQSYLLVGYKFNKLTEYEKKYVLPIYNMILGSMNNSVLFTTVREENSLCYHISSYAHKYVYTITIESGINAKNYEKTLSLIKKCVKSMSLENVVKPLIKNAIATAMISLNDFYDNSFKMIDHYFLNEFENIDKPEIRKKIFKNVSVKDINELNKKINLSTIYFLKGEE